MERGKLGGYDLMIISKYFESIEDFINMEIATPKAKGNMSKFHFNPISLDRWSRQFFTSLQTLHVYNENDCKYEEEQFFKKIIHHAVEYSEEWSEKKKSNEDYKDVVLNKETAEKLETIPEGVTRVGEECFRSDATITEIIMPNSVTSLDICSIRDLNNLTRIVLSTNLKKISSHCLLEFNSLQEISIPDSVTLIGGGVLQCCDQLTSITMPTHWERVGNLFFNNRPLFSTFTIPSSIKSINGKEVDIEEVKEFEIPSNVTKLVDGCLYGCEYTNVIIPTTIKELPDSCFASCKQLKEVTIPTSITKIGNACFDWCSFTSLTIPISVVEIGDGCFQLMTSLKSIEIPTSVTKFGNRLFLLCSTLTSITLHDNYNEVKEGNFSYCRSLSSIVLPSTVTKIGKWSFLNCSSLTSINLENVKEFDLGCFLDSGITQENYPQLLDHCWKNNFN